MDNKDVYYNNEIFGLLPNLNNRNCDYCDSYYTYKREFLNNLTFSGFQGDLPTYDEAFRAFVNQTKYFRDGSFIKCCGTSFRGLTYRRDNGEYWYYSIYDSRDTYHNANWHCGNMWTIPFFRFGAKNTIGDAPRAILKWLEYDLTPSSFKSDKTKNIFKVLKNIYVKYNAYLFAKKNNISF